MIDKWGTALVAGACAPVVPTLGMLLNNSILPAGTKFSDFSECGYSC